jgi:hypothetical protein
MEGAKMKIKVIILIAMITVLWGCKDSSTDSINNSTEFFNYKTNPIVRVQGTVSYFSGGGTREMPYPRGFTLNNVDWIFPSDIPFLYIPIYLTGIVDSSYIGRYVDVMGPRKTITLYGSPSSYIYYCYTIDVKILQIIDEKECIDLPQFPKSKTGIAISHY